MSVVLLHLFNGCSKSHNWEASSVTEPPRGLLVPTVLWCVATAPPSQGGRGRAAVLLHSHSEFSCLMLITSCLA